MIVVTTPTGNIGQQILCGILDSGEMPRRPRGGIGRYFRFPARCGLVAADVGRADNDAARGFTRASTLR
jgi:hypothetical protein